MKSPTPRTKTKTLNPPRSTTAARGDRPKKPAQGTSKASIVPVKLGDCVYLDNETDKIYVIVAIAGDCCHLHQVVEDPLPKCKSYTQATLSEVVIASDRRFRFEELPSETKQAMLKEGCIVKLKPDFIPTAADLSAGSSKEPLYRADAELTVLCVFPFRGKIELQYRNEDPFVWTREAIADIVHFPDPVSPTPEPAARITKEIYVQPGDRVRGKAFEGGKSFEGTVISLGMKRLRVKIDNGSKVNMLMSTIERLSSSSEAIDTTATIVDTAIVQTYQQSAIDHDIATIHTKVIEAENSIVQLYVELGQKLKQRKTSVSHGQWQNYLASQGIDPQRSQRAIRIAEYFSDKSVSVTDLSLTQALNLIAQENQASKPQQPQLPVLDPIPQSEAHQPSQSPQDSIAPSPTTQPETDHRREDVAPPEETAPTPSPKPKTSHPTPSETHREALQHPAIEYWQDEHYLANLSAKECLIEVNDESVIGQIVAVLIDWQTLAVKAVMVNYAGGQVQKPIAKITLISDLDLQT